MDVQDPIPSRREYFFATASRPALVSTQPPIQRLLGTIPLTVKQLGCEADYSPPPNVKLKNLWSYASTPPCLHGTVLN